VSEENAQQSQSTEIVQRNPIPLDGPLSHAEQAWRLAQYFAAAERADRDGEPGDSDAQPANDHAAAEPPGPSEEERDAQRAADVTDIEADYNRQCAADQAGEPALFPDKPGSDR
jgi:hypothetical protein